MLKYFITVTFLFVLAESSAQKVLEKEFNASGFNTLILDSDTVFTVRLSSEKTDKIRINTHVEGEYHENVVVNTSEENKTLTVTTGYSPFFEKENDKLAAHKVIAIDMVITVPETMKVEVHSKIASVIGEGTFNNVFVALENGTCHLKNYTGNATLYTKQGAIEVYASPAVSAKAISKKGNIKNELPKHGKYKIKAESITGSITLLQNK